MNLSQFQETVKDRGVWCASVHGVTKSRPWLRDWTTAACTMMIWNFCIFLKMITTRSLINSWIILDCKTLTVHIITFNYLQASWWNLMLWLACIGFLGGSDGKESAHNAEDLDSISGSGRSSREEKWQPTPVFLSGEFHGRAWWTTVRGVTKSRTPLWLIFFLIFMVKTWRTFPIKFIWLVQITLLSF